MGFAAFGALAVRCDIVERLAAKAWTLSRKGALVAAPELLSLAGCGVDAMAGILAGLGYRIKTDKDGAHRFQRAQKQKLKSKPKSKSKSKLAVAKDSPFAKLQNLTGH